MLLTFLRLPVFLMGLELIWGTVESYGLVASAASECRLDGLAEKLEAICPFNGILSAFWLIKHNESLTFRLKVLFGHNVDDIAKLAEDCSQGFGKHIELHTLLEIMHIYTGSKESV